MSLKHIRLELARSAGYPNGSPARGYAFAVPLRDDGHLDIAAWPAVKKQCRVRRFWQGEPDRDGELHHTRHRQWAFSYGPGAADDEPFFQLDGHRFVVGEYLTVTEQDGEVLTFRVADVN
jgi:hypothetical protein